MQFDGEINLLIVNDNPDNANQLINLLRDVPHLVNPTIIEDKKELNQLFNQGSWNLAIVEYESQKLRARDFMSQMARHKLQIPTIIVASEIDSSVNIEGLRMGADYVVKMDEDQYFLLAVSAALGHYAKLQELEYWRKRYLESELRCDGLIDNSKDAIAIIQEGAFVYVNPGFAQLFGYQDQDDMTLLPVIDTMAQVSQDLLKPYLKTLSSEHPVADTSVSVKAIKPDDTDLMATINISQVTYQSEPALQFLVPKEKLSEATSNEPQKSGELPAESNFEAQPKKVLDQVNQAMLKAERTSEPSLLLYARVDQINEFKKESGPFFVEQLFSSLVKEISAHPPSALSVLRYTDDALVVLQDMKTLDEGAEYANKLSETIAQKTFTVGDGGDSESVALSLTVAVNTISDSLESALERINQCQTAIANGDLETHGITSKNNIHLIATGSESRIKSEEQIIEFGRLLLEKRLIGINFQPIIALQGDESEYYGVLMRPKIDKYPEATPADFIERVFKTEVASEIDRWVILEAVKKLAKKLTSHPNTKLFINLSARTIRDEGFTPWLKVALQSTNVSPTSLVFQFRETDVGHYIDQSEKLIQQLRKLQAKTALAQFGLAINPLLILEKLSVDFIKIDCQMVQLASSDGGSDALAGILKSIQSLTPKVIVPYIENPALMPMLWQHGVDYIQGHYIQEPTTEMNYDFKDES